MMNFSRGNRVILAAALVGAVAAGMGNGAACNAAGKRPQDGAAGQAAAPVPLPAPPQFTEDQRKAIVAYWNALGRYTIEPAPDAGERVNLTVAGSQWNWAYARIPSARKNAEAVALWEGWLAKRLLYDRAMANRLAVLPPDPGPVPQSLKEAMDGMDAPPFFERVRPLRYTVTFAPGDAPAPFVYTDNIPRADRYAYYRSANGVMKVGKRVKGYAGDDKKRLDALFARVGRSDGERRILQAVSSLEGGFEAINTYDTGWVSIGFIQFITAHDGNGSLAAVLARHKSDAPKDYEATFRRFGIDVGPDGIIVAVDPATGQEKRGWDAVQAIINDKRLTAVFERAGGMDGFRAAQVKVARERYWPGDDPVIATINTVYEQAGGQAEPTKLGVYYGIADTLEEVKVALMQVPQRQMADPNYRLWVDTKVLTAKASDLVRSEAGLATLMDRKVNRGNIREINEAAMKVMRGKNLMRLEDVAKYERLLIANMQYRTDFLKDATLSQPPALPPGEDASNTKESSAGGRK